MTLATSRPSDPFLNATVLDDYRVVAHLRNEPRGDTYRALPVHTGNPVLVKLMASPTRRDASSRGTWAPVWERAERLPRLEHPNVERTLDCGLVRVGDADRFCVITELVDGESLLAHVHASGPMPFADVLVVARQVAQGIAAAHRLDIVHGDLRATNIVMVGEASNDGADARAVLCDVGIANMVHDNLGASPTLRAMLYAPESIAPEQIRGERATPATDIYAFGAVLYRLLTGVAPFQADNTSQMLRAHLTRPLASMRERSPGVEVPSMLEGLVRRCLAKRADDRPPSAEALLASLQECEASVLSASNGTPSWMTPRHASSLFSRPRSDSRRSLQSVGEDRSDVAVAPDTAASTSTTSRSSESIEPLPPEEQPAKEGSSDALALAQPPEADAPVPPVSTGAERAPATAVTTIFQDPRARAEATKSLRPGPRRFPPLHHRHHRNGFSVAAIALVTFAAFVALGVFLGRRSLRHATIARRPAPPPAVVVTEPPSVEASAPRSTNATVGAIRFEVRSDARNASVTLRARTYPLPVEVELRPGVDAELVEVFAPGRVTRREWLTLDRSMRVELDLDEAPAVPARPPVATAVHVARPAPAPAPVPRASAPRPALAAAPRDVAPRPSVAARPSVAQPAVQEAAPRARPTGVKSTPAP